MDCSSKQIKKSFLHITAVGGHSVGKASLIHHIKNTETLSELAEVYIESSTNIIIIPNDIALPSSSAPIGNKANFLRVHGELFQEHSLSTTFNILLVVFSVIDPVTFKEIYSNWIQVSLFWRHAQKILLVGNKVDLRSDHESAGNSNLSDLTKQPITTAMGEMLARKISATKYLECSSCSDLIGFQKLIEEIRSVFLCRKDYKEKTYPRLSIKNGSKTQRVTKKLLLSVEAMWEKLRYAISLFTIVLVRVSNRFK